MEAETRLYRSPRGSRCKHLYSLSLNLGRAIFASLCQQVRLFSKTRIVGARYRILGSIEKYLRKVKVAFKNTESRGTWVA